MADEVTAYCVKEKAQKPMKDAHEVILKNGKHAMQGICASCGTKMMKFISAKKAADKEPGGVAEHKTSHEPGAHAGAE